MTVTTDTQVWLIASVLESRLNYTLQRFAGVAIGTSEAADRVKRVLQKFFVRHNITSALHMSGTCCRSTTDASTKSEPTNSPRR